MDEVVVVSVTEVVESVVSVTEVVESVVSVTEVVESVVSVTEVVESVGLLRVARCAAFRSMFGICLLVSGEWQDPAFLVSLKHTTSTAAPVVGFSMHMLCDC